PRISPGRSFRSMAAPSAAGDAPEHPRPRRQSARTPAQAGFLGADAPQPEDLHGLRERTNIDATTGAVDLGEECLDLAPLLGADPRVRQRFADGGDLRLGVER